ncbi:MAG: HAD family hydrolase [Anaeroplasmataceae bacterium]|nr:HAD family hydrolase [Anaeroplasmataceae bacterium]
MIKWIFLDLGSTLIDESECEKYRFAHLLNQHNAPTKEVLKRRIYKYVQKNKSPYKAIVKEFQLTPVEWPIHLERIYEDTPYVLGKLVKKYHLGIIANQSLGTEKRLEKFGIRKYFDIVISSSEVGITKPSLEIFKLALSTAGCSPEEAYMIGDRLDNDIEPAAELNMHTIWVKQGIFADSNPDSLEHKPEIIVDQILKILNFL